MTSEQQLYIEKLCREYYVALYGVDYVVEFGHILLFPHKHAEAVVKLEKLMEGVGYQVVRLVEIKKG
jgi:hypothetical protein